LQLPFLYEENKGVKFNPTKSVNKRKGNYYGTNPTHQLSTRF